MKEIKLLNLKLRNFKGIRELEIAPGAQDIEIFGDNGTGKTTVADAWFWLLFDKDSKENSTQSFDIKTLDEQGNVIHGLEHEVTGILQVDSKRLEFKKIYKEKWTKQRGSATKKFTGHTTDYFINSVPVKKKEYEERISEIIDEDIFKLLTNPSYFNEELHWTDRREILIEVCGDVTTEDVINQNEELEKLSNVLSDRSLEEHQKVIHSKRKEINKELEKIPIRIDEVQQSMPDISALNEENIKSEIEGLKMRKQAKEKKLSQIKNGGQSADLRNQLAEIKAEIAEFKNDYKSDIDALIDKRQEELESVRKEYREVMGEYNDTDYQIMRFESQIGTLEDKIKTLRDNWHRWNEKEYQPDLECPECGHEFAAGQTRKEFNARKAKKLKGINQDGKELKSELESKQEELSSLESKLKRLQEEKQEKQVAADEVKSEIEKLKQKAQSYKDNGQYQQLQVKKEELQRKLDNLEESKQEDIQEVESEISQLESSIDSLKVKKSKIKQVEQAKNRIEELKQKEKELAAEYEKLEEQLYLTEEFVRTKVDLLEEKINSKFEYAEFKLFEEQVNGGVKEVCETTFDGVPYGSGLNTGAQINVGLDIINTLSDHYSFKAPIFIDNAESVTQIADIDAQMVKLIVSPHHKELFIVSESDLVNDDLGVSDLRELASKLNVRNYSAYRKNELVEQINKKIRLGEEPELEEVS
ncbi:AAA family ATPase [Natroniella acetigena]|uniref:Rho termination factor N-terminal domain-containing protein n=1 Tax=Natroniella acetigena TaxID=52004 RepID=UPI00200ADDD1|nr:Rho termination factor N-terminal domain-containing protein [Natroniella acetigena]MCK8826378.1 AAA family ATPase [Natroniella acetigena]